jgi:hypothetical protein
MRLDRKTAVQQLDSVENKAKKHESARNRMVFTN